MQIETIVFYVFAAGLVLSSLLVITLRNPVHAALSLVLAFFSSAALWLLLHAEFLAILLILIYVGAVMVLFLFVVMMLDVDLARLREGFTRYLPLGGLVALVLAGGMIALLGSEDWRETSPESTRTDAADVTSGIDNARALGRLLFTEYLYPFEIAGALLLTAIVAAIAMTQRRGKKYRTPDPAAQIRVRREDRVRLVSLRKDGR